MCWFYLVLIKPKLELFDELGENNCEDEKRRFDKHVVGIDERGGQDNRDKTLPFMESRGLTAAKS